MLSFSQDVISLDLLLDLSTPSIHGSMEICWVNVNDSIEGETITDFGKRVSSLGKPLLTDSKFLSDTIVWVATLMICAASIDWRKVIHYFCRQMPAWVNCKPRCITEGLRLSRKTMAFRRRHSGERSYRRASDKELSEYKNHHCSSTYNTATRLCKLHSTITPCQYGRTNPGKN